MKQTRSRESGATKKRTPPKSVDDYLVALPDDARAALGRLRKTIKAAAPKATEVISYQIPAFRYHGLLVGFAAFRDHCSFYPMSPEVMRAHADQLKGLQRTRKTRTSEALGPWKRSSTVRGAGFPGTSDAT